MWESPFFQRVNELHTNYLDFTLSSSIICPDLSDIFINCPFWIRVSKVRLDVVNIFQDEESSRVACSIGRHGTKTSTCI